MDRSFNYRTPIGLGKVVWGQEGVRKLVLPQEGKNTSPAPSHHGELVTPLKRSLEQYFAGSRVDFSSIQVDLTGFSRFEREVYKVTQTIPYGEKRSYKWVAEKTKRPRACRAVGWALSKNQIPIIIPCHRVVNKDGSLGGWSGPSGWKKKLLNLELGWKGDR